MSYTRQYTKTIRVEGSHTFSYPSSESGGSKTEHVVLHEPITITVNVITDPFDHSVSNANHSIDALTGSVVAMNAAQCAAIQKTSQEVSQHIIDGFFTSIKSELSQQIQAANSEIKSRFGLIHEQGKLVDSKKAQMEIDYSRISSRYVDIFKDLDIECRKRIYALDKQSFEMSEKVLKQLITDTVNNDAAKNILGIQEESSSKTMIMVSGLNRKSREILQTLFAYITQEMQLSSLVESFMSDEKIAEKKDMFIPVIYTERSAIMESKTDHVTSMPAPINDANKTGIDEKVRAYCTGVSEGGWSVITDEEKNVLNNELSALCDSYFSDSKNGNDERVYQTLMNLWHKDSLYSLKGDTK
ncbi:hypothetical protein AGMMS49944_12750 [Spirochaetia bacterium]|nr:hypothetical protein AGMMS49944_12750 [Spirochaetia bacterium]